MYVPQLDNNLDTDRMREKGSGLLQIKSPPCVLGNRGRDACMVETQRLPTQSHCWSSDILGTRVRISPCSFPLHVVTPFSTTPSPSELGLSEDNFCKDTRIMLFPPWSCRPGEVWWKVKHYLKR